MKQTGFVLMEIVVIVGMIAIMAGLLTINLLGSQRRATVVQVVDTLISDIQLQQTKAMTGNTVNGIVPSGFGVYFESDRYTLFNGTSYNASDTTNSEVVLQAPVSLSVIGFPGATLSFVSKSGEISGYSAGQDSVTVFHSDSNESRTIHINRYGIITAVN